MGQKVEVGDYESRGGWRQEKDEGERLKDEREGAGIPTFSSFSLHPSAIPCQPLSFAVSLCGEGPQIREFDAGFVETCRMAPADIRRVILNILERIAPDEDLSNLDDARPFREQMELDSMDFLDIVMELRKQYRIQIPEADYPQLGTMDSTVAYLTPLLKDVSA
jgi:acyl carrier protein